MYYKCFFKYECTLFFVPKSRDQPKQKKSAKEVQAMEHFGIPADKILRTLKQGAPDGSALDSTKLLLEDVMSKVSLYPSLLIWL